jgi:hypothetical protein
MLGARILAIAACASVGVVGCAAGHGSAIKLTAGGSPSGSASAQPSNGPNGLSCAAAMSSDPDDLGETTQVLKDSPGTAAGLAHWLGSRYKGAGPITDYPALASLPSSAPIRVCVYKTAPLHPPGPPGSVPPAGFDGIGVVLSGNNDVTVLDIGPQQTVANQTPDRLDQ